MNAREEEKNIISSSRDLQYTEIRIPSAIDLLSFQMTAGWKPGISVPAIQNVPTPPSVPGPPHT